MPEKILLIDGNSIMNRAFYALPDMTDASGRHTNAIYGFLNMMFHFIDEEKPEYLAVAFDVHAPTFRHEMYAAYKGTRKPAPAELHEQLALIRDVLDSMGVVRVEKAGLEADDILGTLAVKSEKNGMEVSLISGDRDLLQMASDHILIRIPKTKAGGTEVEDYRPCDVLEKYHVSPHGFIELKALMGDASDNIPGVPKIGEKTAGELMVQFGTLDNIFMHVSEITKKSVRESLENNRDLAELSLRLATIKTDAEFDFTYDRARLGSLYTPEAHDMFRQLGFKNFLGRFDSSLQQSGKKKLSVRVVSGREQTDAVFDEIKKAAGADVMPAVIFLTDDGTENGYIGMAAAWSDDSAVFIPDTEGSNGRDAADRVGRLLNGRTMLATYDAKPQYRFISEGEPEEHLFDIMIAAYLADPLRSSYEPEEIALGCGIEAESRVQAFGKLTMREEMTLEPEKVTEYACRLAHLIFACAPVLDRKLEDFGMNRLMRDIEMPLTHVLFDMQCDGIQVDPKGLAEYGLMLDKQIDLLRSRIEEEAGETFNINSPKQLGEILFDKMKIPGGKKTKTGYSTSADVLEKLAPEHPFVEDILEYRAYTKLKSTYVDGMGSYIDAGNRIHSTFNQTITATGRISSTEPNLQNIPMRTELGRQIRKIFIPRDGFIFTDADYSQIELRVLASMAGDRGLIEAYRTDQDIHRITASKVFHVPFEEVTQQQRRDAKAVNFGIVYGISSFGLSQNLSISRKEASDYIDEYFHIYPDIKGFLDRTVETARKNGYVTTLFGRRRPVPELSSSNFMQRSFGERVAKNSPIQGTAADIIKLAMVNVWRRLKKEGLRSRLILQIHDELLIETAEDEQERVAKILSEEMTSAADLAVKLEIDMHTGTDWYEAK
jgi:DNA polymerase-1